MKHLLMVCYGGGHMKVLAPLYAELSGRYRVTVLALTSAGAYMQGQGIPSLGFRDFTFTRSREIQAYGQQLAADVPENGVVPREETVAYLGSSFFDLVNQCGNESAAQEHYQARGRAAFLPVASLRKMIDELNVDAVVTTNAPRAERAALVAAKAAGLPTVCINDNLWIRGGLVDVAKGRLADRICVLSDLVKDELVSETGIDPSMVIVTGTPVFDAVKEKPWVPGNSPVPRVLLADCDLPDVHPFLDLSNAVPGIGEAIREELNRLAAAGLIQAYFRPHPSQVYDYSAYSACHVSEPQENLHERLSKTDVVVTAISTVGIEGKVMGLGLVSIENTVFSTVESYRRIGLSTGVESASELESAISVEYRRMKNGGPQPVYSGVARDNVCAVVDSLLEDVPPDE
jgi:hypothetical protein